MQNLLNSVTNLRSHAENGQNATVSTSSACQAAAEPSSKESTFPMQPQQAEQFAALWAASQPTVSAFIRTLVPDYQQADEVMQRVAVTLVSKYDQ
jgi:hypothetical protein